MLLSVSKCRGQRQRLVIFAVALLFVAGGASAQGPTNGGSESRLLADAGRCYSANRYMAIFLRGYVAWGDRTLTPAQRKQIEAIHKLAKAVLVNGISREMGRHSRWGTRSL